MAAGDMEAAIGADMAATQAFGDALAGTDKPFVNTSGTLMLAMFGLGPRRHRGRPLARAATAPTSKTRRWRSPTAACAPR